MVVGRRDFIKLTGIGAAMMFGVPIEIPEPGIEIWTSPPANKVWGLARILRRIGPNELKATTSGLYYLSWVIEKGPFRVRECWHPSPFSKADYVSVLIGVDEGISREDNLHLLELVYGPDEKSEENFTLATFENPAFVKRNPVHLIYYDHSEKDLWQYEYSFSKFEYYGARVKL